MANYETKYFALRKDSTGKGRIIIQAGFSASYLSNKTDFSKLVFSSMIDPFGFAITAGDTPAKQKATNIDFSAGVLMYSKRLCFGLAAFHLAEPDIGYKSPSPLPLRLVFHGSGYFGKTDQEQSIHGSR